MDYVDELNENFNGEYKFGEVAPSEDEYERDGFTYSPGWFGAEEVKSLDEKTTYLFGGYPDVLDSYKVIELNTTDQKYKVFKEIGVGTNIIQASSVLMNNDYLGRYNDINSNYFYTKGRISVNLTVSLDGEIVSLLIRLHSTNVEGVVF